MSGEAKKESSRIKRELQLIIDAIPAHVYVIDRDNRFLRTNRSFADSLGKDVRDLPGKSAFDLLPASIAAQNWEHDQKVFRSGEPKLHIEEQGHTRNGAGWFSTDRIPYRSSGNDIMGVVCISTDITARKRAEEKVREQREFLRTVLDSLTHPFYIINTQDYTIAMSNTAAVKQDDSPGNTCYEVTHRRSTPCGDEHVCPLRKVTETKKPFAVEHVHFDREGTARNFEVHAYPIFDSRGQVSQIIEYSLDITARKRAEEALIESEERLQGFYDASLEGMAVVEDGTVRDVNRRLIEIFGQDRKELIGREAVSLFMDEDRGNVTEHLRQRHPAPYETRIIRQDGTPLFVEIMVRSLLVRKSPVNVMIVNDITERKLLLEHVLHNQKMECIGSLAGGIAHDFNNILTPIMSSVAYMQLQLPQESPFHEDLGEITLAAQRARDLVKQILVFGRDEETTRESISLPSLLKDSMKLMRSSIPSSIEIRVRIDESCGQVHGNASQLHQVIMNLCTNALQAMGDNEGVLSIDLDCLHLDDSNTVDNPGLPEGTYAALTVSDTGCGMDEETKSQIFEPYFTTKGSAEGSGLGLTVVHGIVTAHSGLVSVRSEIGKGTSFSTYLPMLEEEPPPTSRPEVRIPKGRGRILFVDDERAIIRSTEKLLANLGYSVTSFESSLEALKTFRSRPDDYDLVLTDQTLPGITGAKLTREIVRIRPGMPVIICTGFSKSIDEEEAVKIGAQTLLLKPFTPKSLADAIHRGLTCPISRP